MKNLKNWFLDENYAWPSSNFHSQQLYPKFCGIVIKQAKIFVILTKQLLTEQLLEICFAILG